MNVVLDKYDLLNLVKSQSPNLYSEPNRYKAFGDFWGQGPEWKWDDNKLKESSNEELWSLYLKLKKDSTNKKNPLSQDTICQEISLPEHPDVFYNSDVLQWIPPESQTEKICLTAVRHDGLSLKHVANQTKEICFEAVNKNRKALMYIEDKDIAYLAALYANNNPYC